MVSRRALVVFAASGAASLIYQVAWQRILTIFSGADIHSATIVVAAFMGGLGCGSLAGGHAADAVSRTRALTLFAVAELAIAFFGLISPWLFYDILYEQAGQMALGLPLMAVVLFVSLFWPTFFMGLSLPLLARGLTEDVDSAAPTVGLLYAANTLGAALGAFSATWLIVPRVGLDGAVWVAGIINVGCAIAAVPLARTAGSARSLDARAPRSAVASRQAVTSVVDITAAHQNAAAGERRIPIAGWTALVALSGFLSLSWEIVWFRLLGVMLKSTAFTFGTLLALYLVGLAVGTVNGSSVARRLRRPAIAILLLQAGAGLYAAIVLAVLAASLGPERPLEWFWTYFGGYEPLNSSSPLGHWVRLYVFLPTVLTGPPTVMIGVSFPLLQRVVQTEIARVGRRVGALLAANIAGSTAGSLLTGLVLLEHVGTGGTTTILAAASGVFALLAMRLLVRGPLLQVAACAATTAAVILLISVIPAGPVLWSRLHGASPGDVIMREDGSGLSVLRAERDFSRVVVFVNGLGQSTIPYGGIHTVLGALPAFMHRHPREAAVIGLGSGDTLHAIAGREELARITSIEIIKPQLATLEMLAKRHGTPALVRLLTDPRIEHVSADARLYLRRSRRRFDIIEADALRPTSAYAGNLYSEAYFQLVRERLTDDGLAVTWAPTERVARTFLGVFPYVWRYNDVMIGSRQPIPFDPSVIRGRLTTSVRAYFHAAGIDIARTLEHFLQGGEMYGPTFDRSPLIDINSDLRPWDEFDLSAVAPRARARPR